MPALSEIIENNNEIEIEVLGVSRRQIVLDELLEDFPVVREKTDIFTMDLASPEDYESLSSALNQDESVDQRIYYLSVPPGAAASIADFLGEVGLNTEKDKIMFEKPFGFDFESAQDFIERTSRYYDENQILRIDHYNAKEIALELIAFKADSEKKREWNNKTIESVEIVAHESIGVEGRADFYEQTGAIRDVIQGHLMQLLSIVLMNDDIYYLPEAKLLALKSLKPVLPEDVIKEQYDGYPEEVGVTRSETETFARVTLYSDDDSWRGVPLVLETGKRMPKKATYLKISYKDGSEELFDEEYLSGRGDERSKDAYERVLLSAIEGEDSIFVTSAEVLESWRVLDPAQDIA